MSENTYHELLQTSRNKIELGDPLSSVLAFLKSKGADDETTKRIFATLDAEEKQRKALKSTEKQEDGWVNHLLIGAVFAVVGLLLLIGKLSSVFGDVDPAEGTRKGRSGKALMAWFTGLEGTALGYLIGLALFGFGAYQFYKLYRNVRQRKFNAF